MIVDDEPNIRLLLERIIEDLDNSEVEVFIAEEGGKALKIIKEEKPELVFLDIMMPEINGYDVCNIVKNKLKLKDVYIVMLTAKGQEFDKQKGNEVGADIYMTKPFNPDEIAKKTVEVLGLVT